MVKIFNDENIRILNNYGFTHGTVPVRLNDKVSLVLIFVIK
jgi:hypothetical protein